MQRPFAFLTGLVAMFAAIPAAPAAGGADRIHIIDPVVRTSPSGQKQTAAYMVLHNRDKRDHALVRAASPAAGVTELHTVVKENGMMKMRPVQKIAIKAGGETRLQPGGLHIMLLNLKAPLKEGDKIALTLTFEDGSSKQVSVPVRPVHAGMHGDHHH